MINFAIVGAGAIAKLMATTIKMMNKGGDESVKLYAIASRSLEKAKEFAKEFGIDNPKVIGWDFPFLSQEQINVYHFHGYTAAMILPEGIESAVNGIEIFKQEDHNYAAIHIENPFDNPFSTIPGAYRTLYDFMKVNGWEHDEKNVIPCFETEGNTMDVYIACK